MYKATVSLNNALFFIHDKDRQNIHIPVFSGKERTPVKSKDCIVVFTQHAVDGNVMVTVDYFVDTPAGLSMVFNDFIEIPSHMLTMTTPEGESFLDFRLSEKYKSVSIWVDDIEYPAIVKILIMF